jgi:hypothetical protein
MVELEQLTVVIGVTLATWPSVTARGDPPLSILVSPPVVTANTTVVLATLGWLLIEAPGERRCVSSSGWAPQSGSHGRSSSRCRSGPKRHEEASPSWES